MAEQPRDGMENIRRYAPGRTVQNSEHGFERIVILLLGLVGHGKSSLINSCLCVVNDKTYQNVAGAGKDDGGRTTNRRKHKLTDTIWISDNRGFQTIAPREILEVCGQLRHLRLYEEVVWEKDNIKKTVESIPLVDKHPREFLVPVIVHSCLYDFKEDKESSMTELIKKCQEINKIPPIVVITNVGPPNQRSENEAKIESRFGEMGCTNRICLENYTENRKDRSREADSKFISFLNACIEEAENGIQQRERMAYPDEFAICVANQIKEEHEENETEMKRKLEDKEKELKDLEEIIRKLEQRKWYQNCSIL